MNSGELEKVIQGCIKGKRDSQALLYRFFSAKMFGLCLYYSKNKSDAEDQLQNGFIKVFQNIHKFKGKGSFEGWMRRVFVNNILEDYRKNKMLFTREDEINSNNYVASEQIEDKIDADELIKIIQELSPAYRLVFNLYAIEGYSHKEISKMLNISEGTSKSNLARARSILKQKLNKTYTLEIR